MKNETAILDPEIVKELKDIMGQDFLLLFTSYISDSENKITELKRAIQNEDIDQIYRVSHSLKGSSLNLGVIKIAELCNKIEMSAVHGDKRSFIDLVQSIDTEFSNVCQSIHELIV